MAKLYLDEIEAALSFNGLENLKTDVDDSKKLSASLSEFVSTSSSKLTGEQWDAVRGKVTEYNDVSEIRNSAANYLYNSIKEGLTLLKNYLGEDQMLDSSQLNECLSKKRQCENTIASLRSKLSTEANTSSIRSQINSAEETLKELNRLIKKLEGLDEVYQQALSIFENGLQGVTNLQSKANIKHSGKFVYSK